MLLGCIADDLTGATDLSLMLTKEGLRTVQSTGIPKSLPDLSDADVLVIALKSRSIPAQDAVKLSTDAARYLLSIGAQRMLFKYCSTFDSTDAGNIGPVIEALLGFLESGATIACPAFPQTGRTIYAGHLFVNGVLLNESPMKDHPLNPMRDADLRRVLARQTKLPVGSIGFADVDAGPEFIKTVFGREKLAGRKILIVDAIADRHLRDIGAALAHLPLITGGSGIAMGLAAAYREAGLLQRLTPPPAVMAGPDGRQAILAGSCSSATRAQIAYAIEAGLPSYQLHAKCMAGGTQTLAHLFEWVDRLSAERPLLIYSSADPAVVQAAQEQLGLESAGRMVEAFIAAAAQGLQQRGFSRLLVAGGETSGAVVQALGAETLTIGPEIDPGVPWTRTRGGVDMALALKSGNFGAPDFFLKAWEKLA